jgi:hypothetical protein
VPEPEQRRYLWLLAPITLVACCVGHTLLLAAGIGGIGTLIGAGTGNRVLLIGAAILLTAAGPHVMMRMRQVRADQHAEGVLWRNDTNVSVLTPSVATTVSYMSLNKG